MAMPKIISKLAVLLKISVSSDQNSLYSLIEGYPVQFFEAADSNTTYLWAVIRFDDGTKDGLVKDAFSKSEKISQTGLKVKTIDVTNGVISLKWVKGITGYPKAEKILEQFVSVFNSLKPIVGGPGLKCRLCGSQDITGPILAEGLVDRICPKCIDEMKKKAEEAQAAYDAIPVNVPFALGAAALLAFIGAAIWAGIIVATNTMFWMIAIAIGAGIGWGTTKAAGRGGRLVQVIVFSATVVSILLGMIFYVGYIMHAEAVKVGQSVNWGVFILNIPAMLIEIISDVLFSLGGGMIGAFVAASKAAKANLSVTVAK